MSAARILTREEKASKIMTGALVEAAGGAKAAMGLLAEHGHKPAQSLFYGYADPNDPAHFMPIHFVTILERAVGRPIVTAHAAGELGFDVVPAIGDQGTAPLDAEAAEDLFRRLIRKASRLHMELDEARLDGVIDAADRKALRRTTIVLLGFLYSFLRKLERS